MKLDKNGDSEGNFSVLAYRETPDPSGRNFSCGYQMRPVGQFYQTQNELPVSKFSVFTLQEIIALIEFLKL